MCPNILEHAPVNYLGYLIYIVRVIISRWRYLYHPLLVPRNGDQNDAAFYRVSKMSTLLIHVDAHIHDPNAQSPRPFSDQPML